MKFHSCKIGGTYFLYVHIGNRSEKGNVGKIAVTIVITQQRTGSIVNKGRNIFSVILSSLLLVIVGYTVGRSELEIRVWLLRVITEVIVPLSVLGGAAVKTNRREDDDLQLPSTLDTTPGESSVYFLY
ncbi:hypothetical protein Pcinc_040233 [Petrolisthes cinctipes]|uniref:Uncharacterized protein n=1 Tax=Petrolisthes cinctipes TaxID=88211 RepID=A0AAE1EJR8_PETCI|nr:hypothetical protein Pcinc_040233 [Petrolisthes cinctipes]